MRSKVELMKLLLVQTGFLGDVILSSPVISALADCYPQAEISVLTTPLARELVCYHPRVSETLVFDKRGKDSGLFGLLRMVRTLRSKDFAVVFSLHKSYRTALLLRLAGIKTRYGFAEASMPWLYSSTASFMLPTASSKLSPWLEHPGREGTHTE